MPGMDKTFLLGALASSALGAIIVTSVKVFGISPDVGAVMVVFGVCGAGAIGAWVAPRMKLPKQPR